MAQEHGRRLTVAHFMPWSGIGGTETATLRMVKLTEGLFRNVAFCLHDATELRDSFEALGIETLTYVPPEPSVRHGGRFYRESLSVARKLEHCGADIVHFADEKAAYHNSFAALLAHVRVVCHLRSSYPNLSVRQRLCLLPVHSFIFVSAGAMESFPGHLSANKARVIYDAVEMPETDAVESARSVRQEFAIPDGGTLIGMVARVAPVKDFYTLAAAAGKVLAKHPGTRFLIVGDNSQVELNRNHFLAVRQKLVELGIENRFIFTGHRQDVARLIAAMDICVLCTHREGFGLGIVEAMAMRKPVVATAVGGLLEVVTQGVSGYLHQHKNSEELASQIISLIENPEGAKLMGLAGREHVERRYSPHVFLRQISKAYWDVLGSGSQEDR